MTRQPDTIPDPRDLARHRRTLGLPGSGKTRHLMARYRELRASHPERPVFIVTYSREQLLRMTREVLRDDASQSGIAPVMTYFTLAREVIAASGDASPRVIGSTEERLIVGRIVEQCAPDLVSDLGRITGSEVLETELVSVFQRLAQNGIGGEALDRMRSRVRDPRLRDVLHMYGRYHSTLRKRNLRTFYDVSAAAAAVCERLPGAHPFRCAASWLVDDFQDIDGGQYHLLRAVAPPDGPASVEVFGDPMGNYFGFRGTDDVFLQDVFPRDYACETEHLTGDVFDRETLAPVLHAMVRSAPVPLAAPLLPDDGGGVPGPGIGPLFDNASTACEVFADEIAEAAAVAARVHDMLRDGGRSPGDIAIVCNDKSAYEPVLRTAFTQHGVPLDTGRVGDAGFTEFVRGLVQLVERPADPVLLQALRSSSFYPYLRRACMGEEGARDGDLAREDEAMTRFVRPLARALASEAPASRMHLLAKTCLRPVCDAYVTATHHDAVFASLSRIFEAWREYTDAARSTDRTPTFRGFVRASSAFDATRPVSQPRPDHVGFYSAREVGGRFFSVVCVLGCSETLFPSELRRHALVPARALAELMEHAVEGRRVRVYEAREAADHLHEQHHLIYQCLTRATQRLYLTAPRSFNGQACPAPASILRGRIPEVRMDVTDDTVSPPVLCARAVAAGTRVPREQAGRLCPGAVHWHDRAAPATFGVTPFELSQSALDAYLRCRRQFFYRRVLGIREEESSAQLVGLLFHAVMAELGEQFPTRDALNAGASESVISQLVGEAIVDRGRTLEGSLVQRSLAFHLAAMVRSALRLEATELPEYSVEAVESRLQFEIEGQPFTGRADQIRRTGEGVALVDYKTGAMPKTAKTMRKYVVEDVAEEKIEWQLPLYLWGYRAMTGAWPRTFVYVARAAAAEAHLLSIHVGKDEAELPSAALSRRREDQASSYLLTDEIEARIAQASALARAIFETREGFERTERRNTCRTCMFARTCDRVQEWN